MKIGINLIQYTDVQGIEIFARNLLVSLIKQAPDDEFIFFVNQESAKIFYFETGNVKTVIKKFKKLSRINLIAYQQFGLIRELNKENIDLLYCPSIAAPIFYKKKIVTIHDCASLRFLEESGFFSRIYLRLSFWSAKYYSFLVVTVSNFSRREIKDLLHIPEKRIIVISEGVPVLPAVGDSTVNSLITKFGLDGRPYFFYISNLRPRKNVLRLLEAWADFYSRHPEYFLVIAGKDERRRFNNNPAHQVFFLGIISEEEKVALYKKSLALVFPSLYEGFGLPILEAQSLGVPVLASSTSSLPEIAGDSALFIDPNDTKAMAAGLERIISPQFFKDDLLKKAYKNLERFSWDKSADILLEAICNFK
ncbi:MAG: glycosyltransferase family 1 protein [Patescibacteria group bacterium]|jgi:glycosyltransferase involved in cell wall biosynthesis